MVELAVNEIITSLKAHLPIDVAIALCAETGYACLSQDAKKHRCMDCQPCAYYVLLNHFTQRNTEALVKCIRLTLDYFKRQLQASISHFGRDTDSTTSSTITGMGGPSAGSQINGSGSSGSGPSGEIGGGGPSLTSGATGPGVGIAGVGSGSGMGGAGGGSLSTSGPTGVSVAGGVTSGGGSLLTMSSTIGSGLRSDKRVPLFKGQLVLSIPNVLTRPSLDEFQVGLNKAINCILRMTESIEPWKHMLLNHRQQQKVSL
ncbi:unnamed protein product [Protopolystoma xenopodis]|uniref:Uncharacterized protein n=1 Tax=Protopolystoma xenopodis TaxID=117903 RepID=A0A3S4ZXH4_9PLAT|nr:unnamed protein product [Protopolystoma xenopodis]